MNKFKRPPRWWHFKSWLRWQFEEWIQQYQQGKTWGAGLQCLNCRSIVAKQAHFCQVCGTSLQTVTVGYGMSPNTDPAIANTATQRLTPLSYKTYTEILAAIKAPTLYTQQLISAHEHGERLAKTAARLYRQGQH